jgi:hypothetical protein
MGAHTPRRRFGGSVLRVRPDGFVGSVPDVLSYFSPIGLFIVSTSTHAIDLLSGSFERPGADIGQEYYRLGDRVCLASTTPTTQHAVFSPFPHTLILLSSLS